MVESFLLRFLIKIVGVMTLFSVETILGLMSGTISAVCCWSGQKLRGAALPSFLQTLWGGGGSGREFNDCSDTTWPETQLVAGQPWLHPLAVGLEIGEG